jgi:hypothetical protein
VRALDRGVRANVSSFVHLDGTTVCLSMGNQSGNI